MAEGMSADKGMPRDVFFNPFRSTEANSFLDPLEGRDSLEQRMQCLVTLVDRE